MHTCIIMCVLLQMVMTSARVADSTIFRQMHARAVPLKSRQLDVPPLSTLKHISVVKCVMACVEHPGCRGLNYDGVTATCEMLETYLCDGSKVLQERYGFTYYDIEDATTQQNIGMRDDKPSCLTAGKCSPKCPCEYGTDFESTPGFYVKGSTMESVFDVTLEECQQRCVNETGYLCKSADYSDTLRSCLLSDINRFDAPDMYVAGPYVYAHRRCE